MKSKLLAILTAAVLLIVIVAVSVAASDITTFDALQAAVNGSNGDVIVLNADISGAQALTVNKDAYIDLNGFDITCPINVTGGTLYCMDSQTDDYSVADGIYGKLTGEIIGKVVGVPAEAECAEDGYLAVSEDDGISFHRVNLQLYAASLRAKCVGFYLKSHFAGDELVAKYVQDFGIALSVCETPNEKNLESLCSRSVFTGFQAGVNDSNSTLLYNIMKKNNEAEINERNSNTPIYGRAYIQTKDGYLFGIAQQRTLKQLVETAASNHENCWHSYTDAQRAEAVSLYRNYAQVLRKWDVKNIESALVLNEKEPLNDGKTLKLLAITSSFGLNTTQMLYDVAVAEGYAPENVTVARLYTSGCTLEKHLKYAPNGQVYQYTKVTGDPSKTDKPGVMQTLYKEGTATLLDGLLDEDWDIIFMQQGAAQAPQLDTYLDAQGNDRISQFRAIVDLYKTNPDAKFVWNMLWGYQGDSDQDVFVDLFRSNQMYMYQRNVDAVMEYVVPRTDYDRIIPSGTAMQNARSSYFGDRLCYDTYHTNNLGGIIAAYDLFAVITGQELTEINLDFANVPAENRREQKTNPVLTETDKQVIMESINNALKNPFSVTQSNYPPEDYSGYSFTAKLDLDDNNTAVCPACQLKVTWLELNQANYKTYGFGVAPAVTGTDALPRGVYHFYLSEDIEHTATIPFFRSLYGNHDVCLHLNGHDLTSTKHNVAEIGSNTKLNIMGTGTVCGSTYTPDNNGSTLIINSSTVYNPGTIRLYSGTYTQPTGKAHPAVISTGATGGKLEIYEDATIIAKTDGYCFYSNTTNKNYAETINIYGGTFNRPFNFSYASDALTTATTLNIYGGTFKEGIEVLKNTNATLSGAPQILGAGLKLGEGITVTPKDLTEGAKITLGSTGTITAPCENIEAYKDYFATPGMFLSVKDNVLSAVADPTYVPDSVSPAGITDNLVFTDGNKAYCPVCQKEVTWTPITQEAYETKSPDRSGTGLHYYLAEDVTYIGEENEFMIAPSTTNYTVCFHLNGHNITATKKRVFFGSSGILNVMGSGTATGGYNLYDNHGATVGINTGGSSGTINLYSGTYTKGEGCEKSSVVYINSNGGKINIYKDVRIVGTSDAPAVVLMGAQMVNAVMNIDGAVIEGDINAAPDTGRIKQTVQLTVKHVTANTVMLNKNVKLTVAGNTVIRKLDVAADAKFTVAALGDKARIDIAGEGVISEASMHVPLFFDKFTSSYGYTLSVVENALVATKTK